jgi:hypothetical protein
MGVRISTYCYIRVISLELRPLKATSVYRLVSPSIPPRCAAYTNCGVPHQAVLPGCLCSISWRDAPLYWDNRPSLGYRYDVAEAMGKNTEFGMRLAAGSVFVVGAYWVDSGFSFPKGCGVRAS